MITILLPTYIAIQCLATTATRRTAARLHCDERGEGVISAAVAVLIMAFLGALMWVAFKDMFTTTTEKTNTQVGQIGS